MMQNCRAYLQKLYRWSSGKKYILFAGAAAAAGTLWGTVWYIVPACLPDPMAELKHETPVRMVYSASGECIGVRRTWDWQWRKPVPLSEVSRHVKTVILAVEDEAFFEHDGVDFCAVLRAAWQGITAGRRISGASTITMQLAALPTAGKRKNIADKIRQVFRARALEMRYSKEEILSEYLNRILFGGKVYGIEAAALYYFGVHARDLNLAEAALLCGLPQKPNAYRPDLHRKRARERMNVVLHLLVHHGKITPEEAASLRQEPGLRFRDFRKPFLWRELEKFNDWTFGADMALAEAGPDGDVQSSLSREETAAVSAILRNRLLLTGAGDAAAVVMENKTGKVRVLAAVSGPGRGTFLINGTRVIRSAGSVLKPFLYLEALSAGFITEDTLLEDAPIRFGNYAPGNFDGKYRGRIPAHQALADSLNTPAVRLLAELGEKRVLARFRELDLLRGGAEQVNGLALALGSAGHTLLDVTNACSTIASGGIRHRTSLLKESRSAGKRIFPETACRMLLEMLDRRPVPLCTVPGAWKTGTSSNFCDSWCVVMTEAYTVGVWFGNHTGVPVPGMTGLNTAAPAAGEIVSLLYAGGYPAPSGKNRLATRLLCVESGLRPGGRCRETAPMRVCRDIPLRQCRRCGMPEEKRFPVRILSPLPGEYVAGEKGNVTLLLAGNCSGAWFIDGVYCRDGEKFRQEFAPGVHRAVLFAPGTGSAAEIRFRVREPEKR